MATNLTRRIFLRKLAGGAVGLTFLSPVSLFALPGKRLNNESDLLSFIDLNGMGPEINAQNLENKYIALHAEGILPDYMADALDRVYVENLLRETIVADGGEWDETDRILWTYQYYGFCDHSEHCEKLMSYCGKAQDYLYNSVQGLNDANINWNLLSEEFDYEQRSPMHFTGLIGRFNYLVNRVSLMDTQGNMKDFGLVSATPVNRAINYIISMGSVPSNSMMYIIPGNTSLMSPFSELLHLTTHGPAHRLKMELALKYNPQYADEVAHIIGETITESAAILTAQQFLKRNRLSDRMNFIDTHARSLNRQYSLMSDMLAYMQLYGVQKTLMRFTENPLQLFKAVSHSLNNARLSSLTNKL